MIPFQNWLEDNQLPRINFAGWLNDGRIIVFINGIRHLFVTDALYHHRWKKMAKTQPQLVMSQIQQQVNNGHAQQLEPAPKQPASYIPNKEPQLG